jgi:hypothetical protein
MKKSSTNIVLLHSKLVGPDLSSVTTYHETKMTLATVEQIWGIIEFECVVFLRVLVICDVCTTVNNNVTYAC